MIYTFSLPRAIWWGDRYIGTVEPAMKSIMKHNMDVDYYLSREAASLVTKPPQEMTPVEVDAWYQSLLLLGFHEVESMEASRELRDIWFFANVAPSWLPADWKDELVMGATR